MLQDIKLLKQLNFNAVRNAHYPNHMRWWAGFNIYAWQTTKLPRSAPRFEWVLHATAYAFH